MMAGMSSVQALPVLYSFRRCPYAMRARMALWYSRIPVELREVILRDKPRELVMASAKATVPVLVLPDGRVIDESYDIMKWALLCSDPNGWLDIDPAAADALIERNDVDFKPNLDRYKYPERFGDRHPQVSAEVSREKGLNYLHDLDALCREHPYLFGERISMIDVAVAPFVRQFANVDLKWFESTAGDALKRWLARFVQSELFLSVMLKYPRWSPGHDALVFSADSTSFN
jgi:glutathione S-transferase